MSTTSPPVCPACRAPHGPHDSICAGCGLVFATFQPLAAGSATAVPAYLPGQVLAAGRYTIQCALSKGGMGAVYLATDHSTFDRPVVIKALLDYFDPTDPAAVQAAHQRFVEEARTLAHLRHPTIPQIYAYFHEGPHICIAMEYIEGRDLQMGLTLSDETTGQPILGSAYPTAQVLRWGVQLCQALDYLARRQPQPVMHHDIKPANLLLEHDSGAVRLVDFGTAKARLLQQPSGGVGLQKSSIYGTQGYAPPEQYRGESEPRSDVYALAATLYHLATDDDPGLHPFTFPQLDQLGGLGQTLRTALDLDVTRRPTAQVLGQQLEALLTHAGVLQTPDGSSIADVQDLVQWCEAHWELARTWLYATMPDQIAALWGQIQTVDAVRDICQHYATDHDAGLDALLRFLDPQFPMPQVVISPAQLDCGTLTVAQPTQLQLTMTNTGRGYATLTVHSDTWLVSQTTTICLQAGQMETISFNVALNSQHAGGQLSTVVRLASANGVIHQVPVSATFVLQAPGGIQLSTISAVVTWCVQHWQEAQKWLYSAQLANLPEQVERWGHMQAAQDMREVSKKFQNRDEGLDQALALLDPEGYGAEQKQLTADTTALTINLDTPISAKVRLTNSGRRYVWATIECPPWIKKAGLTRQRLTKNVLPLRPGESTLMTLTIERIHLPLDADCEGDIRIFDRVGDLLQIPVAVPSSLVRRIWWRSARRIEQAISILMAPLLVVVVSAGILLHVFLLRRFLVCGTPNWVGPIVLFGGFFGILLLTAICASGLDYARRHLKNVWNP